jgi:hypothetical protein
MLPADIQPLNEVAQTITVVFLLLVAVTMLWRKWGEERQAREADARRYEGQIDDLRSASDRRCQDIMAEYLDDMRHLAGMKEAAWGVQRAARQSQPDETRHLSPFPARPGS